MAKQKVTTVPKFKELSETEKYTRLRDTEFRVQRLERLCEGLLVWGEWSNEYKECEKEFREYMEEEQYGN